MWQESDGDEWKVNNDAPARKFFYIPRQYILDECNRPVLVEDIVVWGRWMSTHSRRVQHDTIPSPEPGAEWRVSTVFLGLDHRFGLLDGPPVLWETMVFYSGTGYSEHYVERYTSHDDALAGHANAILFVHGTNDLIKMRLMEAPTEATDTPAEDDV